MKEKGDEYDGYEMKDRNQNTLVRSRARGGSSVVGFIHRIGFRLDWKLVLVFGLTKGLSWSFPLFAI